jgi:HEAT repeat protein
VSLPGAALAMALAQPSVSAVGLPSLTSISVHTVALAEGVMSTMFLSKFKCVTAALLAVVVLVSGITVFGRAALLSQAEKQQARPAEETKPPGPAKADRLVARLAPAPFPRSDKKVDEEVALWIKLLNSDKRPVRFQAMAALGEMGARAKRAVPALMKILQTDKDGAIRVGAATALGQIGPAAKDAVVTLVELLLDEERYDLASTAARSLGMIGPGARSAVPALRRALKSNITSITYNGAWALGEIGEAARVAVPDLLDLLDNVNPDIKATAAVSLWRIEKHADAVPALIKHLDDKNALGRGSVALGLAEIGPGAKAAVPALLRASKADDPNDSLTAVRSAYALWKVSKHKEAIPTLIEMLRKDKSGTVRSHAAMWLGFIGGDAKEAIPALTAALKDTGPWVSSSAAAALKKIGPEAAKKTAGR